MLEQLFGSKTRVRLLRLFLHDHQRAFFVRELTRRIGSQINAVRNELDNLVKMGLVEVVDDAAQGDGSAKGAQQRKYFRLDQEALLFPELRALFTKAQVLLEKDFVHKITQLGQVSYIALTGFFTGDESAPTDLIVVGRVNRDKMVALIAAFEREVGKEVNYTVMTPQEYKYRRDVTDRFLYSILESKKIVVLDTISERLGLAVI
jgi:hypothetical protein